MPIAINTSGIARSDGQNIKYLLSVEFCVALETNILFVVLRIW